MVNPRLLDLFSGAGGCSVGYARAGFDVVGVDVELHPDYPFELIVADALTVLQDQSFLASFDVIHASPPCQAYSTITPQPNAHPRLIEPVRQALREWGGPYVIENVEGARRYLDHPVKICGSAFGLGVQRHRYFESNRFLVGAPCAHNIQGQPIGVYGDHAQNDHEYRRPDGTRRGAKAISLSHAADVMGIDWMTNWDDLTDAIPPVYCEHLGAQLLDQLTLTTT